MVAVASPLWSEEAGKSATELAAELVLVIAGLLLIAALSSTQTRRLHLPFTTILVVLGMGLALLAQQPRFEFLTALKLTPGLVFFVFVPGLLFEAAFNIDSRRLLRNLGPILTLAIPALVISAVIVGTLLHFGGGQPLAVALVFGALISATDPVAVLAIFKELGAPKRLAMLVDGESLFNDGTSVVLFKILLGVALAGTVGWTAVLGGLAEFVQVFGGGVLVGLALGWLGAQAIARVWRDHFVENTLSLVLAYGAFALAEHLLHVSGVMATVVAGLTLGNYGRTKISPDVLPQLEEFWEYLASLINALLFLLVGLSVDLIGLVADRALILLAIGTVLIARGLAVFGLLPILNRFLQDPVDRRFQTVLYWGGLRGALALAMVLSLPEDFAAKPLFINLAFGVVLFTLLAGSPTVGPLLRRLGLMQESADEVFESQSALVLLGQAVRRRLAGLRTQGAVSAKIADELAREYAAREQQVQAQLATARAAGFGTDEEERLLRRHCLLIERRVAGRLFADGDISEPILRELQHRLDLELAYLRWGPTAAAGVVIGPGTGPYVAPRSLRWPGLLVRLVTHLPVVRRRQRRRRALRLARRYEAERARWLTIGAALEELAAFSHGAVTLAVVERVRADYQGRRQAVAARLAAIADQFPEYVETTERSVALRFSLRMEAVLLEELHDLGLLSERFLRSHAEAINERLRRLGAQPAPELLIDPKEALRQVPVFADLPDVVIEQVAQLLTTEVYWEGEEVICEGEPADAVYLVGRGVVEVRRKDAAGRPVRVGMMRAGGFFGETAFLEHRPHRASVVTTTPCTLLRLATADLDHLLRTTPMIERVLQRGFREHAAEVAQLLGQRRYPRVPLRQEEAAAIETFLVGPEPDTPGKRLDSEVLDLSLGGVGLETREPVPIGARLRFLFRLAGGRQVVRAMGRIVSRLGTGRAADSGAEASAARGERRPHRQGVAFDEAPNTVAARFLR